jgi:hypothetical protein
MTKDKLLSIAKGAAIAMAGGAAAAGLQYLGTVDWGIYAPLAGAGISIGINALRKWLEKPAGGDPFANKE